MEPGLHGKGSLSATSIPASTANHPALKGAIQTFAEFDNLGFEITPAPKPHDSGEHGSHTAATIAGRAVQGRNVGMAPEAMLACALVIEGGTLSRRPRRDGLGGRPAGARARMSLGFRGWWEDFVPITADPAEPPVLPVFAVGNEGPGNEPVPGTTRSRSRSGPWTRTTRWPISRRASGSSGRGDALVPDLIGPGVGHFCQAGRRWQDMDGT